MKLVLIRHGEMQGDPWCRPQRPVSNCLSARGVAQAEAAARALAGRRWHAVFSSPLGRALQTAEIVCGRNTAIQLLPPLEEWQPNPALVNAPSTVWEEMMRRDADRPLDMMWQTDAGEGTYAFCSRVVPGVLATLDALGCHPRYGGYVIEPALADAEVAMVAHGGSLGTLLTHLLGMRPSPSSAFGFRLAGMAELDFVHRAGVWHPQLVLPSPAGDA